MDPAVFNFPLLYLSLNLSTLITLNHLLTLPMAALLPWISFLSCRCHIMSPLLSITLTICLPHSRESGHQFHPIVPCACSVQFNLNDMHKGSLKQHHLSHFRINNICPATSNNLLPLSPVTKSWGNKYLNMKHSYWHHSKVDVL